MSFDGLDNQDRAHREAYPRPAVKPPPAPMKLLSFNDMQRMRDPEWLIDGLIQDQRSTLMFGASNSFKSFLAVDIACSISCGYIEAEDENRPWHGHHVSRDVGSALYVATEGAIGVAKQRIPGWLAAHGITPSEYTGISLYPQEIALDDDQQVTDLIKSAGIYSSKRNDDPENWECPVAAFSLIIIDIFGSSMMGTEVSDETARAWVHNINRIQREIHCATLTVAHTGWSDDTRARMHSHFWGSFDTRLKVEGDKDARTCVLKVERHKDADSSGEWGFKMETVTLPDGGTTLYPVLSDDVSTKPKRRVSGKPLIALQALDDALLKHGRKIQTENLPSCQVVEMTQWRAMCDRHGLADTDTEVAAKKAFQRSRQTLLDKGEIRMFDAFVWRAET